MSQGDEPRGMSDGPKKEHAASRRPTDGHRALTSGIASLEQGGKKWRSPYRLVSGPVAAEANCRRTWS